MAIFLAAAGKSRGLLSLSIALLVTKMPENAIKNLAEKSREEKKEGENIFLLMGPGVFF
jgi:hypothetical protein